MERNRFNYVCLESEAGNDAVVIHHGEHGLVDHCSGEHLLVKTPEGEKRCWDYHECDELYRSKEEFPWR
jgi:hypothetical protein